MNYDQALIAAYNGQHVMREHWHWVTLTSRPDKRVRNAERRILVLVEDDGSERGRYSPTTDDTAANDWTEGGSLDHR